MKKLLPVILILLLTINLVGCQQEKEEVVNETNTSSFEYKFKDEYSDKIRSGLAKAFIDFVQDTKTIYVIGFDDFEPTTESEISDYMGKAVLEYREKSDAYNEDEKEVLELMLEMWDNIDVLSMVKTYHAEDEENKSIGIETKYTDEFYNDKLVELKGRMENSLEKVQKFID